MSVYCPARPRTDCMTDPRLAIAYCLLRGQERKILKLLCKQYFVLECFAEWSEPEPIFFDEPRRTFIGTIPDRYLVIMYLGWPIDEHNKVFEWRIKITKENFKEY